MEPEMKPITVTNMQGQRVTYYESEVRSAAQQIVAIARRNNEPTAPYIASFTDARLRSAIKKEVERLMK
jgi:hypothetical protein